MLASLLIRETKEMVGRPPAHFSSNIIPDCSCLVSPGNAVPLLLPHYQVNIINAGFNTTGNNIWPVTKFASG